MDHGKVIKKIFQSKQDGIIRMGSLRLRWLEHVEKNLRDMTVKRWWQKAVDREWAPILKQAKAVRGLQSQVTETVYFTKFYQTK
jgi:hypothetical protein